MITCFSLFFRNICLADIPRRKMITIEDNSTSGEDGGGATVTVV